MSQAAIKPTSVKLDVNTKNRIKQLADSRDRTAHWVMQQAIQQYLDREEKRDQFRKETIAAWNDYQETGLHVTADEVSDWLDTWRTDKETEAPICHK
jgi:predicted transcriptional regulator